MDIRFVSDIGSNHNGSWLRCSRLIDAAKQAGANAVKFQLFTEDLYRDSPQNRERREKLRTCALPVKWIPDIAEKCRSSGLEFHCTPFYLEAVDILAPYVQALKIGSYEIRWLDLIRKCAMTLLPLGLSLGLSEMDEELEAIETAIRAYFPREQSLTLYHCCSEYPAPIEYCNLAELRRLVGDYHMDLDHFGWSDHSGSPGVIHKAIHMGADTIEFHLDLEDMAGSESVHGHCWTPSRIGSVISDVRIGQAAEPVRPEWYEYRKKLRNQMTDPVDGQRPINDERSIGEEADAAAG